MNQNKRKTKKWLSLGLLLMLSAFLAGTATPVVAQDTVTGAFEGVVSDSQTGAALKGALVEIVNPQTGLVYSLRTDYRGRFYQGLLLPGVYTVRVSMSGYQTKEVPQRLRITYTGEVVPVPVALDPVVAVPTAPPAPAVATTVEDTDIRATIVRTDGRRSGSFTEEEVVSLPLGGTTITRTFDELALLLPGVVPPPQTLGDVAGPGVGAGVGSAGQFSANGLRSRANNFTVDGSDNNDEDIGVRRQGFLALVPQPIESIQEYQVITLLAPAQFGRNIGAQVNAVSKSGGNETHGSIYGLLNSSQLNARNFFDTTNGSAVSPLRTASGQAVLLNGQPLSVRNQSGGEDSFTAGQGGLVLGGPLAIDRMFYFIAAEGQLVNATKEESFAVPTIEQRGVFATGATAISRDPFGRRDANGNLIDQVFAYPTTSQGDAIFSLYPFPNNPNGIFGANTFTQVLPASAQGKVLSGKFDGNFKVRERQQTATARYNFTDDWRDIPAVNGAIFSSLRSNVRTQNFSFFLNGNVSSPAATNSLFNQVRLSYGRTRLNFEELRDRTFLRPSDSLPNTPFLLNAPLILNSTLPTAITNIDFGPNVGPVRYTSVPSAPRTEAALGVVGQVNIAGFSPVGVDVFNFPQTRVNNTYQAADTLTYRARSHTATFGVDARRSELNSALPRNARSLITFNGAPEVALTPAGAFAYTNRFIRPETFAAASAASGFSQTLATGGESEIGLRFYQLNFFGQDSWRIGSRLSLSYGLRYEYNTPVSEVNHRIESTFNDPSLSLAPGLRNFIGNRTRIYDPDRNNFAPRVGLAYSPHLFGREHTTVFRGGYGLFYDQILGAVASQSRNVYPTFLTIDLAGGFANLRFVPGTSPFGDSCQLANRCPFEFINPQSATLFGTRLVRPGTLNTLNPALSFAQIAGIVNLVGGGPVPALSGFGVTLPAQKLEMPMAHHFSFTWEQQIGRNFVVSTSYIGTLGRKLLRFTTPNLGTNALLTPLAFSTLLSADPMFFGLALPPGARITPQGNIAGGRPVSTVGAVTRFESTANSRYDALQLQARGRFAHGLQYQLAYTLSKTTDEVSDIFDMAGASALPQDSFDLEAERGPANFDARHRFAYNFIYTFGRFADRSGAFRTLAGGLQIASTGQFQTGQPFTVNTIFDVNLDGNLTDRLNNTSGITVTNNRQQPLQLTTSNPASMLAAVGQDGSIDRNSFRAGNVLDLNLAVIKNFAIDNSHKVTLRVDIFNFINRANFGVPVRFLEAPGFGKAINTVTPGRRVQIGLKYLF
ncbi:MAG TPA: carboxypeptidase-like regulatory domain-containing protein [Pyrinomonadaceae bacterium]|nr:carboxypeptidase-like regulatory domain-containing protein [Pyrinomonadaceae bacterium]